MTIETLRAIHLFRDGIATVEDPPAVIDALLALRRMAARTELLEAAGVCLRARPVVDGEWLVVTGDGHAYRFSHCCLDDETAFEAARVVRLTVATPAVSGTATAPTGLGAAGSTPVSLQAPQPGGFSSP